MLRAATDADTEAVLAWRNHPDVRAASLTRHEITPAEHAQWWDRTRTDHSCRVLIYERRGVPSGVVVFSRYDRATRSAWWSFHLDVAGLTEGGRLLPAWIELERDAIRYASTELGLSLLVGEVLASNESVRALHRRHRMVETERYQVPVEGSSEEVVRVELRLDA